MPLRDVWTWRGEGPGAEFSFAELRGFSQQVLEDRLQIARRA